MPHGSNALHMAAWCTSLWSGWLSWRISLLAGVVASHVLVQERLAWELLVWSSSVRRLEGWAHGGLEDAQRRVWWCPIVLGSHSTGDDVAVPGMVAQ
jgi:hypothetical protein